MVLFLRQIMPPHKIWAKSDKKQKSYGRFFLRRNVKDLIRWNDENNENQKSLRSGPFSLGRMWSMHFFVCLLQVINIANIIEVTEGIFLLFYYDLKYMTSWGPLNALDKMKWPNSLISYNKNIKHDWFNIFNWSSH